jgi:hypothetical protein
LVVFLDQTPSENSIILDDLNLSPEHSRQLEDLLARVLSTVLQRKGHLIITSQKGIPQRLSRHLELKEECTQVAPALKHEEIAEFAVQFGCPSVEDARAWAAITLIHTNGHIQLVHAQVKNLARRGWPKPSTDDILQRPDDVEQELSEARMLLQGLPESHRELLYRLSIVAGLFRRDHAIAIGELEPAIPSVGDVYDQLIGPWIEHVDQEYMRVSPLLKNCAARVWSGEKTKQWQESVGIAILRCAPRTAWEASTVLMHGILSRSAPLILAITNSVLSGTEKVIKAVAPALFWLKMFIKPGTPIFPESNSVNFMLRLLQFRVAAELEPGTTAVDALAAWESDPMPDSPPEFTKCARSIYLGSFVHAVKVPIAPRKLVRAIVEMADLGDSHPPLKEILEMWKANQHEEAVADRFDPISVALLVTTARPVSVQFLEELLDALDRDAPDATRARMLSGLRKDDAFARLFLDAVWFDESKATAPNWPNCIRVFERCIALSRQWNVPELVYAAARGIAIIRDEYQNDGPGALTVLDDHKHREGRASITIENERATVFLHLEEYDTALACWEQILPYWQNPPTTQDTSILFAINKAGIAAARVGDWRKAGAMFADGAARANLLGQQVHAVGFATDVAWALWKAGEHRQAYDLLCETLIAVEGLPAPKTTPHAAKVQKSFGHILVCIKREIECEDYGEFSEPPPGLASDPAGSEVWQAPPLSCCLVFLAEIESYFGREPVVFQRAGTCLADSRSPLLRSLMAELGIRYAFRKLHFERLPQLGHELETSLRLSDLQRKEGRTALEDADTQIQNVSSTDQSRSMIPLLLTQGLIASLAGKISSTPLIQSWEATAARIPDCTWINRWLESAKRILILSAQDALAIMGNETESSDMRVLAAARLMSGSDTGVDRMFNAQVWVVGWVGQSKMFWNYDLGIHLASVIALAWKRQCEFKASLRSPRLSAPEIERECEGNAEGIAKAAKILLAAENAVTIRMNDDLRKHLQAVASAKVVNPYRFANLP